MKIIFNNPRSKKYIFFNKYFNVNVLFNYFINNISLLYKLLKIYFNY